VVDDATQRVRYVELREGGEGVAAIMTALLAVLERYGAPMAVDDQVERPVSSRTAPTCCSAARRAESSPSAGIPDEEKSVTARAYAARKGHSSPQSS
jgi:hypothetical protein